MSPEWREGERGREGEREGGRKRGREGEREGGRGKGKRKREREGCRKEMK